MALPEVKNCDHLDDGWCLDCAKDYHDRKEAQIKIITEGLRRAVARLIEARDAIHSAADYIEKTIRKI